MRKWFSGVPSPSTIKQICAEKGFDYDIITGESRLRLVVNQRYDVIATLCEYEKYSIVGIGRSLNRDHTTILHALRRMKKTYKYHKSQKRAEAFVAGKDSPPVA